MAKRLMHDKGICGQLHGYRLSIEVNVSPAKKLASDMVIDFYVLKEKLGAWLNKHWEHNVILNAADKKLGQAITAITKQKIFYTESEPTAEALAIHIKNVVMPALLPKGVICRSVCIYDTDDAWVTAE